MKVRLNKKELAGSLGISNSYLSMILSGKRKCPSKLVDRLQSTPGIHKVVKKPIGSLLHTQEVSGSNPLLPSMLLVNFCIHMLLESCQEVVSSIPMILPN